MLRFLALATLAVYWTAMFVGTHMPHGVRGVGRVSDKILHFGGYAGLAFLLAASLTLLRLRHGALLLPMIVAAIYGCFDELSQLAVPGRQADVADWAADVMGAGVGVLAFGAVSFAAAKIFTVAPASAGDAVTKSPA